MSGCKVDDDIKGTTFYDQYVYDGEDLLSLDPKTMTWVYTEKTAALKKRWGTVYDDPGFINFCPQLLKKYLEYGNSSLQRKGTII